MNEVSIESVPGEEIRTALLGHYDRTARPLPWRRDTDPYHVLVSEFMLQQTQVETVKKYYERWLERFPRLADLAEAEEDEVLKAWEGLGYYRRARNLHRTAMLVREEYGGVIPSATAELRALPGVGEYTAGALSSIAFNEPAPAVDGNVRRVLARLYDVEEPKPAWLRDRASELIDPERPGDWNQALMELGATVCSPRAPQCPSCPLARWCSARRAGTQAARPAAAPRREVPTRSFVLALVHHEGEVLMGKRPAGGLLAGMWAFPERALAEGGPRHHARDLALQMAEDLEHQPADAVELPPLRHRFTHLEATYLPWSMEVGERSRPAPDFTWLDPSEPDDLALPVAQRRVLASWMDSRQ